MGDEDYSYNEGDGESGSDHFEKTVALVKRVLPSLFNIKVVCYFGYFLFHCHMKKVLYLVLLFLAGQEKVTLLRLRSVFYIRNEIMDNNATNNSFKFI